MKIVKRLDSKGSSISLFIKVIFDDDEMKIVRRFGFLNFRIKTKDGPFVGRDHIPKNLKSAYRSQLGRIKNRWSPALVRTSGFALVDTVLGLLGLFAKAVRGLAELFVGRRKSLLTATRGITVRSRHIEEIKEAELFILVSLAAVAKAIDYARRLDEETTYAGMDLLAELDGLDFAGAGSGIESDLEAASALMDEWSKIHG